MDISEVRRMLAVTFPWPRKSAESEEPIRAELFSADRLEQYAESLIASLPVSEEPGPTQDLPALASRNGRVLLDCYGAIAEAARQRRAITPAAEWVLDNFHVIDEQLKSIRRDFTPRFASPLPALADGPLRGYPRVYALMWAFVAHTDSRLDLSLLRRFVQAAQRSRVLTIRELWALPLVLRCVLIENLTRLAQRIVESQLGRRQADELADELQANPAPGELDLEAALRQATERSRARAFAVQLVQRLRYRDPNLPPALEGLAERLATQGTTWDRLIQIEHASQAAANVTVRNLVTSMRAISASDWQAFFEEVSLVDECLRESPAFSGMDYLTRDRYRHAIEDLAAGSGRSELEVARVILDKTLNLVPIHAAAESAERLRDPGYYLISSGRTQFEEELGYRLTPRNVLLRWYVAHAIVAYLGSVAALTALLLGALLWLSAAAGVPALGVLLLGLTALIPASEVGLAVINRWVTRLLGPRHLPRLDLASGVPEALRTFVAVPTLLTSDAGARQGVLQLEVHYLANPAGDVRFALLSDWADADAETANGDERLLAIASEGIAALNRRYGPMPDGGTRFFLFHRRRQWSGTQRKWMGWERKRGKLAEFNRLLRGAQDTSFMPIGGAALEVPSGVRYVITLDADTRLPLGAVRHLVGTAAHPLNAPRFDPQSGAVVEGYGILQPRVTPRLPSAHESSIFQRLFSAPSGVDLYAAAISDVYQDLFGEGSFTGKGLYDVDAFEAALADRIPEEAVLSHDLLEGVFARCALVSDIELFEDFPSHSEVSAARAHRWARGDWQLLPWMFGRAAAGISTIGRWKLIDNLRRSLFPLTVLMTLIASWSIPRAPVVLWLIAMLIAISFPMLLALIGSVVPPRTGVSKRHHLRMLTDDAVRTLGYAIVGLTLLAQQAWLMLDAIVRTLVRLTVTHRNLLEWTTAAQVQSRTGLSLGHFLWPLRSAALVAIIASACVLYFNRDQFWFALPFILLWWASPLVARAISLPPEAAAVPALSAAETTHLRLIARRTWRFFTTFVTAQDHWLPPDNFQEDPKPMVAHRTSPTNFGLGLLAIVAARDFGWIGMQDMAERLERTLETLLKLPRYRGHFYNWYETTGPRALDPQYISSVDSGNLAGHLLALEQACMEITRAPVFSARDLIGVRDAVLLMREALDTASDERRTLTVDRGQVHAALEEVESLLAFSPAGVTDWATLWHKLETASQTLLDIAQTFAGERAEAAESEVLAWAEAIHADVSGHARDVQLLALDLLTRSAADDAGRAAPILPALGDLAARYTQASTGARAGDLESAARACSMLLERLARIASVSRQLFNEMDFRFLFDPRRKLFSIGYRASDGTLDESFYDLLASEARLLSFIAIAKGEVPVSHWFKLGRPLLPVDDGAMLLSWSGSMFEYLMPSLVMYTPSNSLLDGTCKLAVQRQIEYGAERGVPWGVSESAFSTRDRGLVYQYSAFGVPGLGFKRGLRQELVVAPYATALAAMYDKRAAAENFDRLQAEGGRGIYGFFEALDFTPARLPENRKVSVVRAHFAHHQGMSLVALTNALIDDVMRQRFHRHPMIQAADLLLQERTPREIVPSQIPMTESQPLRVVELVAPSSRRFHSAHLPRPCAHLLSNGRYTVMVTAAGSGYSTCDDLAVTRWREDPTCDSWGSFIFLRDAASGEVWSAGFQPTAAEPDHYDVNFSEDRARIHRLDGSIATTLEILVSPEDDAEVRRLSISNNGLRARELEVTSYCEVVLAPQGADVAHPVFSNLFVQTEFVPEARALLAARRSRKATEPTLWAAHVLALPVGPQGHVEYETDRTRFLGRNHFIRQPVSVMDGRPLSNTVGAVLDPIFSLRTRVRVEAGATIHLCFATIVAGSREQIVGLADKYYDPINYQRISTMAWTHAQVQLYHLGVNADEANLFQWLADGLIYSDATLRPTSEVLKRGRGSARDLWRYGISGDRPILLLRIDDVDEREIVRQLLRAHDYWRNKRFAVDLVFLNEKAMSYAQDLQMFLEGMVRTSQPAPDPRYGGIYVLSAEMMTPAEIDFLHTAARVILVSKHGSVSDHVVRLRRRKGHPPYRDWRMGSPRAGEQTALPAPKLTFFNGLGGFSEDGREYVTVLSARQHTPLPWANVIANEQIGLVVSESGAGYSWCGNSRENQLTPWSNDPVSDAPGEVIYLRDEDSGELWTPTPAPVRVEQSTYIARHSQGYSRFEHLSHRVYSELTLLVAPHDPVKLAILALENRSTSERTLTVTYYVEWALGPSRAIGAPYIVTELDAPTGALFAQNPWNAEFAQRVAFIDMAGAQNDWTGDRCQFLGRNGSVQRPAALVLGSPLGKQVGAGLDPCGVLRTSVRLAPQQRIELTFVLGQAADHTEARALVERFRASDPHTVLVQVKAQWESILGTVQVRTPDAAMNVVLNRWLLYQALACRMWARAGFYQAGGAYGFRDQLQDSMALALAQPQLLRQQLLRSAARQFPEGDVQHWWHPPSGRGVRTHCSDDKLWLPYVAAHYVSVTGDQHVLDEVVSFLEGEPVPPEHEDAYFEPVVSKQTGTLFEHCARAIDSSLATGAHGLPLIGTGDWNDGMNRVGREGRGESIWLGWFLYATLVRFAQIATDLGHDERAARWSDHAGKLQQALERDAWDGAWYRRAYFDDGTPLGSASSAECRIDSLAQSWSVISGAGDPQRARRAMQSVEEYLVRPGDDLILLFTPPFDKTPLDPGYIKGYLPGVRENGGQYTHAAVWCAIAVAGLGEGDAANELFRMLNPINRTATRAGVHAYKVEPYVVAADIYSEPPHVRRGGWTWYTGAAGWLYRAGTQSILGLSKAGDRLHLDPCIPRDWREYTISYRFGATLYEIVVKNPDGVMRGVRRIEVDGAAQDVERGVELIDDGRRRVVLVVLG
jgi:cyclic beta-1,2-glucan synthetase